MAVLLQPGADPVPGCGLRRHDRLRGHPDRQLRRAVPRLPRPIVRATSRDGSASGPSAAVSAPTGSRPRRRSSAAAGRGCPAAVRIVRAVLGGRGPDPRRPGRSRVELAIATAEVVPPERPRLQPGWLSVLQSCSSGTSGSVAVLTVTRSWPGPAGRSLVDRDSSRLVVRGAPLAIPIVALTRALIVGTPGRSASGSPRSADRCRGICDGLADVRGHAWAPCGHRPKSTSPARPVCPAGPRSMTRAEPANAPTRALVRRQRLGRSARSTLAVIGSKSAIRCQTTHLAGHATRYP